MTQDLLQALSTSKPNFCKIKHFPDSKGTGLLCSRLDASQISFPPIVASGLDISRKLVLLCLEVEVLPNQFKR